MRKRIAYSTSTVFIAEAGILSLKHYSHIVFSLSILIQ